MFHFYCRGGGTLGDDLVEFEKSRIGIAPPNGCREVSLVHFLGGLIGENTGYVPKIIIHNY